MVSERSSPLPDKGRRRRRFLLGSLALVSVPACRPEEPERALRVPLASLPDGGRLETQLDDEPIVLHRHGDSVVAMSLWCSHMGCRVGYRPNEAVYLCPCHDGRFDDDGRVLGGPPTEPLRTFPARIEGDQIVIPFERPSS